MKQLLFKTMILLLPFVILASGCSKADKPDLCKMKSGKVVADPDTGPLLDRGPVAAIGPLKVLSSNSRYFTYDGTRAVYLTGSHTPHSFQDVRTGDTQKEFDYDVYLDFLRCHNHNFVRLWTWEDSSSEPFRYRRLGPGMALDGELKFDLTRIDEAYLKRLRSRIKAAGAREVYVAVMLFQGRDNDEPQSKRVAWDAHPFNIKNNVNSINGDPNGDEQGAEMHTLIPAITELQEAYIKRVIDTVNDLDNVLYEISNESPTGREGIPWQQHLIRFIRDYERKHKPKQHPILMTWPWPSSENHHPLHSSPADAIYPDWAGDGNGIAEEHRANPPSSEGHRVIMADTGRGGKGVGDRAWVWKSFMRGLNPIFMDPYDDSGAEDIHAMALNRVRVAMGHTRTYAKEMNLAGMVPRSDLASTGYCLANIETGKPELLVYAPQSEQGEMITVDLSTVSGMMTVEWFNPEKGEVVAAKPIAGGAKQTFTAPFHGDAVLHLAGIQAALPQP